MWFRFKVLTLVANKCPRKKKKKGHKARFFPFWRQANILNAEIWSSPTSLLPASAFCTAWRSIPSGPTVPCLSWLCCLWPALRGWLPNSQHSHGWQFGWQALREAKGWASHGDYGKLLQLGGPWHPSLEIELHSSTMSRTAACALLHIPHAQSFGVCACLSSTVTTAGIHGAASLFQQKAQADTRGKALSNLLYSAYSKGQTADKDCRHSFLTVQPGSSAESQGWPMLPTPTEHLRRSSAHFLFVFISPC